MGPSPPSRATWRRFGPRGAGPFPLHNLCTRQPTQGRYLAVFGGLTVFQSGARRALSSPRGGTLRRLALFGVVGDTGFEPVTSTM